MSICKNCHTFEIRKVIQWADIYLNGKISGRFIVFCRGGRRCLLSFYLFFRLLIGNQVLEVKLIWFQSGCFIWFSIKLSY